MYKNAEVRECEFGRGVFSTCFMPAYTKVLEEIPLCTMQYGDLIQFSPEVSEKLLNLCHETNTGEDPAMSAFHMNAFSVDPDSGESSVYFLASMFNHDCLPTCHVYILDGRLYIYTMQAVQRGQQLTISYINSFLLTREHRRRLLMTSWNFDCMCSLCSDNFRSRRYSQFVDACKCPGLYTVQEMENMMDAISIPRTHYVRRVTLSIQCSKQLSYSNKSDKFLIGRYHQSIRRFHRDVKDPYWWLSY